MPIVQEIQYRWFAESELDNELLDRCASLFSGHYGVWSEFHPEQSRAGQPIRLPASRIRKDYLPAEQSWAALAFDGDDLVAYALLLRAEVPELGRVDWVTQLVVHRDYRDRGVAKRLLNSVWGFSDHAAWGLVTPNPFAIRALEKATRRRCDPARIAKSAEELCAFGESLLPFIQSGVAEVSGDRSVANTQFWVDHSDLEEMLTGAEARGSAWILGRIGEGEEWFAFTFGDQEPFSVSDDEFKSLMAASDQSVRSAYERMKLDPGHRWAQHTVKEVDFLIDRLELALPGPVLDFGCGSGRHAIELGRRGYRVVGVDFSSHLISKAAEEARRLDLDSVEFRVADCRTVNLSGQFAVGLCLYDVIGSFADDDDNDAILRNLVRHVAPGGAVAISVMNMASTRAMAKPGHIVDLRRNPDALLALSPSSTMETTGNIFDPEHYLIDSRASVVYRKEQFSFGNRLPAELLVRDRRYLRSEIRGMCEQAGIDVVSAECVQAGRWNAPVADEENRRAKEVLLLGRRHKSADMISTTAPVGANRTDATHED